MSGRMVLGGREGYHSPIVRLVQGSSWCVRGYPTVLHVRTSHLLGLGVELCGAQCAQWVRAQMIPTDVRASCGVVPHSFEDHTLIPLQGLRLGLGRSAVSRVKPAFGAGMEYIHRMFLSLFSSL